MRIANLSMTVRPGSIVTGSVTFEGKSQASTTATGAGTPSAANNNTIANAIDHIEGVYIGATSTTPRFGLTSSALVTEITWQIDNQLRAQHAVGTAAAVGVGVGIARVTGTLSFYLENVTELAKYLAGTASSLAFRINDGTDIYIFSFPQILFTGGGDPVTGASADGIVTLNWSAQQDSVNGIAMQVDKFGSDVA